MLTRCPNKATQLQESSVTLMVLSLYAVEDEAIDTDENFYPEINAHKCMQTWVDSIVPCVCKFHMMG